MRSPFDLSTALMSAVMLFILVGLQTQPAPAGQVCDALGLPSPCLETSDIMGKAVSWPKVNFNAVSGANVQNNSLTGYDIENGSIHGLDIQDATVRGIDIKNSSLTGVDILDGTLTGDDIADGTITSVDIADGTIGTGPAGGDLTGIYPNPQIAAGVVGSAEINSTQVQARVTDTCPDRFVMVGIGENGNVTCIANESVSPGLKVISPGEPGSSSGLSLYRGGCKANSIGGGAVGGLGGRAEYTCSYDSNTDEYLVDTEYFVANATIVVSAWQVGPERSLLGASLDRVAGLSGIGTHSFRVITRDASGGGRREDVGFDFIVVTD